jgi:hypothetical protein
MRCGLVVILAPLSLGAVGTVRRVRRIRLRVNRLAAREHLAPLDVDGQLPELSWLRSDIHRRGTNTRVCGRATRRTDVDLGGTIARALACNSTASVGRSARSRSSLTPATMKRLARRWAVR